jgi:hypothetical protein
MSQPQFEQLLAWASEDRDDIIAAKGEYFAATGEPFEDDAVFESRMQGFFNWYLLDRARGTPPMTPAQRYLQQRGGELSAADKPTFLGFTKSRHSLFEIRRVGVGLIKVREDLVKVRDAFTGDEYVVTERRRLSGLERGDLLEARLLPVGDTLQFSPAFTYHPRAVRGVVLKEIKKRKKAQALDPRSFCWELARMALHLDRFRNIPVDKIYNFETPFLGERHRREAADG